MFGSGSDTLVLTLAEDAFQGDARFNATIDGQTLNANPLTVTALHTAGQSEAFTFKGPFGPGAHDLSISFINDAYSGTPTTDRNLYVNGVSYNGFSSRPSAAELDTASTARFTIPPAGDPESTPTNINGATFGTGPDTLTLTLGEDAFQGDAQFNVAIDGKTLNATAHCDRHRKRWTKRDVHLQRHIRRRRARLGGELSERRLRWLAND